MIIIHEPESVRFAKLLAEDLEAKVHEIQVSQFQNGEFSVQPIHSNGDAVLLIFPDCSDLNIQILKLFLILKNIKHFKHIDIFMTYIPYSRQDKSEAFQFILNTLKNLQVRQIVTIDIHKETDDPFILNILPHELFGNRHKESKPIIVAPDIGAIPRATAFARYLQTELITIDKRTGQSQNLHLAKNRDCLVVDDIIDSGRTIMNARKILTSAGARSVKYCTSDHARRNICEFHDVIARAIKNGRTEKIRPP